MNLKFKYAKNFTTVEKIQYYINEFTMIGSFIFSGVLFYTGHYFLMLLMLINGYFTLSLMSVVISKYNLKPFWWNSKKMEVVQ